MNAPTRLERLERCARLVGRAGLERLECASVTVFGLGGVGSYCAEALARCGLGRLRLVDHDVVVSSNCNRQLQAAASTLGRPKAEALGERLRDLAPELELELCQAFLAGETAPDLLSPGPDWVVDAIDSLGPKVELLRACQGAGLKVVSAMGAARRLDPTLVRLAPLAQTKQDALAAQVRKRLRRRGTLDGVVAAYSLELPAPASEGDWPEYTTDLCRGRQRRIQPSMVMVPAAMGMAIASHVVRDLVTNLRSLQGS